MIELILLGYHSSEMFCNGFNIKFMAIYTSCTI